MPTLLLKLFPTTDDVIMVVIGTKITCCDGASFILRAYVGGMFYDTKCDPRQELGKGLDFRKKGLPSRAPESCGLTSEKTWFSQQ